MFRSAAEAHDGDILKMYNVRGSLVSIGPSLPANTPDTRYKLEVVAVSTSGNIVSCYQGLSLRGQGQDLHEVSSRIIEANKTG